MSLIIKAPGKITKPSQWLALPFAFIILLFSLLCFQIQKWSLKALLGCWILIGILMQWDQLYKDTRKDYNRTFRRYPKKE